MVHFSESFNDKFNRYAWSSLVTFLSVFLVSVGEQMLVLGDAAMNSITTATVMGVVTTAGRLAVKSMIESVRL